MTADAVRHVAQTARPHPQSCHKAYPGTRVGAAFVLASINSYMPACASGEGLDYKAMGSIFSGLVQCGAWGCFDEFNRIEAEVLSVVSSQIRQIQEALKNGLTRFPFEGTPVCMNML